METLGVRVLTLNALLPEAKYYDTVYALTPKEQTQTVQTEKSPQTSDISVSPWASYAPFIIFFALFIGAFGLQLLNRVLSIRRIISALVIALFVASTPFVLTSVREGTRFQSQAGPEEQPRRVQVVTTQQQFQISWTTDAAVIGAVRIGVAPLDTTTARVLIADDGKPSREHTVLLGTMAAGNVYEYEIYSGTQWYDNNGHPLLIDLQAAQ